MLKRNKNLLMYGTYVLLIVVFSLGALSISVAKDIEKKKGNIEDIRREYRESIVALKNTKDNLEQIKTTLEEYNKTKGLELVRRVEKSLGYSEPTGLTFEMLVEMNNQAKKYDMDLELLISLIARESNFNPNCIGPIGELGLGQLNPNDGTAQWLLTKVGVEYSRENALDPSTNIKATAWYLNYLLNRYDKDAHSALTAYNRGMGNLVKYVSNRGTSESTYSRAVIANSKKIDL